MVCLGAFWVLHFQSKRQPFCHTTLKGPNESVPASSGWVQRGGIYWGMGSVYIQLRSFGCVGKQKPRTSALRLKPPSPFRFAFLARIVSNHSWGSSCFFCFFKAILKKGQCDRHSRKLHRLPFLQSFVCVEMFFFLSFLCEAVGTAVFKLFPTLTLYKNREVFWDMFRLWLEEVPKNKCQYLHACCLVCLFLCGALHPHSDFKTTEPPKLFAVWVWALSTRSSCERSAWFVLS